jgi:hypothetical protein
VGFCEHGNEPSGSIKGGERFAKLSNYQLSTITLFYSIYYMKPYYLQRLCDAE